MFVRRFPLICASASLRPASPAPRQPATAKTSAPSVTVEAAYTQPQPSLQPSPSFASPDELNECTPAGATQWFPRSHVLHVVSRLEDPRVSVPLLRLRSGLHCVSDAVSLTSTKTGSCQTARTVLPRNSRPVMAARAETPFFWWDCRSHARLLLLIRICLLSISECSFDYHL